MRSSTTFLALALFASTASAQFNDTWLTLVNETATRLPTGATVSDNNNEVDFAWGDLDLDGFTDLVVVRKEPYMTAGLRPNILLMNEAGILQDRTASLAFQSSVVGDSGFLTPTNDRDVAMADVDGDGWLDVITAPAISDGLSKAVGHPRIYINLGNDQSGQWLGLRYEEARFPQLISYTTGLPENPRFMSVSVGDVTGDGAVDLYFSDHDSSAAGGVSQPAGKDLNDRLLVNDGTGYFTDESQLRMTPAMLISAVSTSSAISDMNGDGVLDIVKNSASFAPVYVVITYNNPQSVGNFNASSYVAQDLPYYVNTGDLNNDGRLDLILTDDNADYFRLNLGNDPSGQATWGANQKYDFLGLVKELEYGGNNMAVDLDGDGWLDTIHADVDADTAVGSTRLHIYHNRGTTPGQLTLTMREERESAAFQGSWLGAVGLYKSDLLKTFDFAPFDIDNDGDLDLVIGRKAGTQVWMNANPTPTCGSTKYGIGSSPVNDLDLSTTGLAGIGTTLTFTTLNAQGSVVFTLSSVAQANQALFGGIALIDNSLPLLPMNTTPVVASLSTWSLAIPLSPPLVGFKAFFQSASLDASHPFGWALSNGVAVTVCP